MIALLLTRQIVQLFLIMLFGFLVVRLGLLSSADSRILSVLSVYVIQPCTIINAFQIEFTPAIGRNFMLAVCSALIIHVLLFIVTFILNKVFHLTNIEKASLIYSNAGNLIIPLVTSILGSDWVIYSSAFLVVQLFILWTHGKSLVEGRKSADLKKILTNINLIACAVGLIMLLCHIELPDVLHGTVTSIAGTIGPVCMLMLGMILAGLNIRSILLRKRTWIIAVLKMLVMPALILMIMKHSGISSLSPDGVTILYISLLATMTPSATTVTQMAQLYHQDVESATSINTITTLVCIATMPLMTMLYYM